MIYVVNRDVSKEECPWLDHYIRKGLRVYKYRGHTYGCISPGGVAVTAVENVEPFFELPKDALTEVSS